MERRRVLLAVSGGIAAYKIPELVRLLKGAGHEVRCVLTRAATEESEAAGDTADDYIRLTLVFASALFFAGITASFRTRAPKIALLVAAGVTLAVAGALLVDYPVA